MARKKSKNNGMLKEGKVRKGGLGNKPSTQRPQPPQAQQCISESKETQNLKDLLNYQEKRIAELEDEILNKEAQIILLQNQVNQLLSEIKEIKVTPVEVRKVTPEHLFHTMLKITKTVYPMEQCEAMARLL